MIRLIFHRLYNLCWGAWQASVALAQEEGRSTAGIYFDFLHAYCIARIQLSRYVELRRNAPDIAHRDESIQAAIRKWRFMRSWEAEYRRNYRFLSKYTSLAFEGSIRKKKKQLNAYAKRYNMGKNCWVQYDVTIIKEHYSDGTIRIGNNVLLARGVDLDFTGGLEIGDNSALAENVKILTHAHDHLHIKKDSMVILDGKRAVKTPLRIGQNVHIGARTVVFPGVGEIGDGAWIGADEIVRRKVPPHCMVRDGRCVKMPLP